MTRYPNPLGTDGLYIYLDKYNLELDAAFNDLLGQYNRKPWSKFVHMENAYLCCPEAIDLVDKMLVYDHSERILPCDALQHPYFHPILVDGVPKLISPQQQQQQQAEG